MENNSAKKKTCFIITPIGEEHQEVRRHADGVIEEVIYHVLQDEFDNNIKASHSIYKSGSIFNTIIDELYEADLVIANLTYLNPNVMYEVAIRHAIGKPIIHIVCSDITSKLPFDIQDYRTFFYRNDIMGTKELKSQLSKAIKEIDYKLFPQDNPLYNALKGKQIEKIINVEVKESNNPTILMLNTMLEKMDKVEKRIRLGEASLNHSIKIPNISPVVSFTFQIELSHMERLDSITMENIMQEGIASYKRIGYILTGIGEADKVFDIFINSTHNSDEEADNFALYFASYLKGRFNIYNVHIEQKRFC